MCNQSTDSGISAIREGNGSRVCWHIRPFALGYLDGTLGGMIRLFVQEHIARCRSCQKALAALRAIGDQLHALRSAPPTGEPESLETERWAALESAWQDAEKKRAG